MNFWGIQRGDTLGSILDRHRGIGPGFDALRFLLAFLIFFGHTKWAAGEFGMDITSLLPVAQDVGGSDIGAAAANASTGAANLGQWVGWTKPIKLALVPMFFALSGFLVMGSAVRLRTVSTFLAHRGLRIFPALVVEVTMSALILGPLVTSLSLQQYFSDNTLLTYFGNAVGHVTFSLPGVFEDNPVKTIVNVNLWTLPSEFYCYLIMAGLMMSKIVFNRTVFTILFAVTTVILVTLHFMWSVSEPSGPFPPHVVIYYFLTGVLFFHWRDRIPVRWEFFLAAMPLSYGLLYFDSLIYLAPWTVAYMTVAFGTLPIPKSKILSSGDYSYGIYLYGFPIAQTLLAIWPDTFRHNLFLLLPTALVLTVLFAVLSWHCIEKHALALKRMLPVNWFPTPGREKRFETAAQAETGRIDR